MTTATQSRERTQVKKYMRICIQVHEDFETTVSISPSEPLLANAARFIMNVNPNFDMPGALLKEMQSFGLDKGDRGELIAEVLLIQAIDVAIQARPKSMKTRSQSMEIEMPEAVTTPIAVSVSSFITSLLGSEWHDTVLNSRPTNPNRGKGIVQVYISEVESILYPFHQDRRRSSDSP